MAENRNKNLDKDMNKVQGSNIGSSDLDKEKSIGQGTSRTPSEGGFSGSTGSISGRREGMTGEGSIEEEEGSVERGSSEKLDRDVERGGRS